MKLVRYLPVALMLLGFALPSYQAADLVYAQMKPVMTAKLVDADAKASQRTATVEVTTSGVELTDPAVSNEKPVVGQGHLHYQLDRGPVIATPTPKLSFHELGPGAHTIVVMLAGNDHKLLGPRQELTVNVPLMTSGTAKTPASRNTTESKPKSGY